MSTKTLRKRIALVAVSAMGFGLMTSVSAQAANNAAWGGNNAGTAASVMNIATKLATTAVGSTTIADQRSEGLLANSTASNTTATATMRADGKIVVYLTGVTDGGSTINVTNGTFQTGTTCDKTKTTLVSGTTTRFVCVDDSAALVMSAVIAPTSGATSMTIDYYQKADVTAVNDGSTEAAAVTTLEGATVANLGTLTGKITVTVVPTNSFFTFTGTYCALYDSDGAITSTQSSITSIVVPVGATYTVTSTKAADVLHVTQPGYISAATNTIDQYGTSVPLTSENSSTATVSNNSVGTYKATLTADGSPNTVTDTISVTVVSACKDTTFSADYSKVETQTTYSTADTNVDEDTVATDGNAVYVAIVAKNGYNAALPSGTWIASATNGAKVGFGTTAGGTCGATSTASTTGTGSEINVAVCQGTDYVAQDSVVTISYEGTTVVTKTVKITGDLAKIEITSPKIIKNDGNSYGMAFKSRAFDAAGNQIVWAHASISADLTKLNQIVTSVDVGANTSDTDYTSNVNTASCALGAKGSAVVRLKGSTNAGTTVYSNDFTVTCGSTSYTYAASLDKASYVPGDIATLTITAKDSNGNLVHDAIDVSANGAGTADTQNYVNGSNAAATIAGSNMDAVVAPAAADVFDAGIKKYTFKVGSTEGSYQMSVNLTGAAFANDVAKTVGYTIKSSSATVTNAEVLAAIVKLIASINKQIKALQKQLGIK